MAYSWKDNAKMIFAVLKAGLGNNEIAAAGIMGNYRVECGILYGFVKQGNVSAPYTPSLNYTANVNNGTTSKSTFVYDQIGYGLAQWTYFTLKDALYEYWKYKNVSSIGDTKMQAQYQIASLKNDFSSLYNQLVAADGLREATNLFLDGYENPKNPEATRELRYQYAIEVYEYCTGTPPDPDPPEPEPPDPDPPDPPFNPHFKSSNWIYYMKRRD